MAWTPRGYIHIREWLDEEVRRRGEDPNNTSWSRAFDDLADFLANEDDPEESQSALFVFESGSTPHPVPLFEWRKRPDQRSELSNRRVYRNYNVGGFGSGEFGFVAVRLDLRLTDLIQLVPDVPAVAAVPEEQPSSRGRGTVSSSELRAFLSELDHEFKDKSPPSLATIGKRGVAQFGKARWRKNNRDQRNAVDDKGAPLYPNLFCTTPGKR